VIPGPIISETLVERLAEAVHASYLREQLADGAEPESTPGLMPWAELTEDLREANRAQARDIATKLDSIGAGVVPAEVAVAAGPPFAFTDAEIENLARIEHERWAAQRVAAGWTYAAVRDDESKQTPFLTTWDKLPRAERDKDRDAVRNIPAVLATVGLAVARMP
jgi:RyR domain-containing protein